jgi:outer membrane lipopolysaccharide assembly protein LptE/RlpB
MKTIWQLLFLLLLIASGAVGYFQWKNITDLSQENHTLKIKSEQAKAAAEANFDRKLVELDKEVDQLRAQIKEIARLRNEVQQLRKATNEVTKLRQENEKLKEAKQSNTPAANPTPGKQGAFVPKENWSFAGYATPESAVQSAIWAVSQGDMKNFLGSLSPEIQDEVKKAWAQGRESEAEIMADGKAETQKSKGYQIQNTQNISPDEVVLSIQMDGKETPDEMTVKRIGAEWKLAGPRKQ